MASHKEIEESVSALKNAFAPEELNPILQPYVYTTSHGWDVLNHPLVQCVLYTPHQNKILNHSYRQKMKLLAEAINEQDWDSYVFLHERPFRARALRGVMNKIPPDKYWPLIRSVWIDTENLWQWGHLKRTLLMANKPYKVLLMNEAERGVLSDLEEVAPLIFRGFTPPGRAKGWSWTFDRTKAEWFARRFTKGVSRLAIGEVYSKDIIAYFESRNEWEVVVDPTTVRIMEIVSV